MTSFTRALYAIVCCETETVYVSILMIGFKIYFLRDCRHEANRKQANNLQPDPNINQK